MSTEIDINQSFTPVMVLSVFQTNSDDGQSHFYIERRVVHDDGSLGAAAPLKTNTLKEIAKSLSMDLVPKLYIDGIIHPRVLHLNLKPGFERLVWWHPATKKRLLFTNGLGIPDGEYSIPKLIFSVKAEYGVDVWAITDEVITENTKLYRAPFPNVGNGHVCMGNAHYSWDSSTSDKTLINEIETRFFESRFSHDVRDNEKIKGNYVKQMMSLNGSFPNELLIETKEKLKDAIRK